jgi:BirA family transcriptional regulator, biotin operon repressor / biotin---[acetyl-CoA-carboxylase] ligase
MFALAAEASAAGHALSAYESVGSTMTEARRAAEAGNLGPRWFAARRQTAGRGRRGNAWTAPEGNLSASLLWPLPRVAPAEAATLGFVAGVALRNAIRRLVGPAEAARLTLKWPNDLLADGAKLAGILLELDAFPAGQAVILGIGVNVAGAPTGLPYAAGSLRDLGCDATAPMLFTALTAAWVRAARTWDEGRGFPCIREAWLRDAAGLGGPVTVRLASGTSQGTFETIDEAGRLVMRGADGATRHVAAGEVHLGMAASAA